MIELNMAKFNVKNPQTGEFEPLDGASQAKVQSDWNQTDNSAEDFIKNKPTIPAAQVNSDWTASSGAAEILNKPLLGTAAAKDYTTSVSGLSDDLITSSTVNTALANKADLENGKVPAAQLPSYVDDVLEYDSTSAFPVNGESGKIYVATDTNKTYRWGGSAYVEISESLALGETASTAYPGNKGKANADAIAKKPGEITTGKQYVIGSQTVTAGAGAEAFNDLVNNKASGDQSHAEGRNTTASGDQSHAEGRNTTASGAQSHAEGIGTTAVGDYSHAEGIGTTAAGHYSHAEGTGTTAYSNYSHTQGKYNAVDANGIYAFIIGNGTADNARHNAFAIDWNGLIYVNGSATGVDVKAFFDDFDNICKEKIDKTKTAWIDARTEYDQLTSDDYDLYFVVEE